MAAIGRGDDAVDLQRVAADRDLGAGGDVAAVAHVLREAAEDAGRRRLAPAGALGHRIEHREMLRMVAISLRRNSSGSWPAACASSSMKHSR